MEPEKYQRQLKKDKIRKRLYRERKKREKEEAEQQKEERDKDQINGIAFKGSDDSVIPNECFRSLYHYHVIIYIMYIIE